MHKYAASSPESRELVSELEFVWDQVKSNVPSSSSSSPPRNSTLPLDMSRHGDAPPYQGFTERSRARGSGIEDSRLRVLSPTSRDQLYNEAAVDGDDDDEFVDAPDSQVDDAQASRNIDAVLSSPSGGGDDQDPAPGDERKKSKRRSYIVQPPSGDEKWKKSISSSIIKLTAELAAVKEQLESRRLFTHTIQFRIFRFMTTSIWGLVRHIAIDALVLGVVLLWLRSKKDRRFEGAIFWMLGDAVAQVQKLGDRQLGTIRLPKLVAGRGKKS